MECNQFILEFPLATDYSFDSFIAKGENRLLVQEIINLQARPKQSLTLVGEAGVGKTHLLQAAVSHFNQTAKEQKNRQAIYLDIKTIAQQLQKKGEESMAMLLSRYETYSMVAIDALEQLKEPTPMQATLQEAVLFLFNRVRANRGKVLFASRLPLHPMPWLREDLHSRLLWGEVLTLAVPNDEELGEILNKMAQDRQVLLTPELIRFLQLRLPRQVAEYAKVMDQLDRAGMGLQHRLTVPLAKKVLNL